MIFVKCSTRKSTRYCQNLLEKAAVICQKNLIIKAKGQTHHLNKPNSLKLSRHERHWIKVNLRLILTSIAKMFMCSFILQILSTFAPKPFTSSVKSSQLKDQKANLNLLQKSQGQPKVITKTFFGKNLQNFP